MNNLLGKDFADIERMYDLKGSTFQRLTKLTPQQEEKSGLKVLKDMNFVNNKEKLAIPSGKKDELYEVIKKDAQFLSESNLMDYSMLFVKVSKTKKASMQKMPALIYNNETNNMEIRAVKPL